MNGYDDASMHRLMVEDRVRTDALRRAIAAVVRPGATVLDVGAGCAILSLFAWQAGAARVYALERAPGAAALARHVVAANGAGDVIRVVEADAVAAWLPERVDVVVSEWLGAYGIDENMLAPVLRMRERWLRPGGAMVPAQVRVMAAPIDHPATRQAVALRANDWSLDLDALDPNDRHQALWLAGGAAAADLRAPAQPLWSIDCATMPADAAARPWAAQREFVLDGAASALAVWFDAALGAADDGVRLANAPGDAPTHWGLMTFPLAAASRARAGQRLHVGFHNVPGGPYGSHHLWAARVDDGALEVHDTRLAAGAGVEPPWRAHWGDGPR